MISVCLITLRNLYNVITQLNKQHLSLIHIKFDAWLDMQIKYLHGLIIPFPNCSQCHCH